MDSLEEEGYRQKSSNRVNPKKESAGRNLGTADSSALPVRGSKSTTAGTKDFRAKTRDPKRQS